ncbi:MAG: GntR family transcriptional regulator [Armatimonadota bacterium]|nr:GntR family transcriptional regulator [Armatimonadota bacterium]
MNAQQNAFAKTRLDHASETSEDYVEVIYRLSSANGRGVLVRTIDVVNQLHVAQPTVTKVLARLEREGLIRVLPRQGIELTATGKSLAKKSMARHELVLRWLKSVGVSDLTADLDAEGIEHHLSEESLRAIKRHLNKPGNP